MYAFADDVFIFCQVECVDQCLSYAVESKSNHVYL